MGAADAHAVFVNTAYKAQKNAALNAGNARCVGGLHFGVILVNGGAVHDHLGIADVFGGVAKEHLDTHGLLGVGNLGLLYIAAGDLIAALVHDLNQRIHTAAAHADKVQAVNAIQKMGVVSRIRHKRSLLYEKRRRGRCEISLFLII